MFLSAVLTGDDFVPNRISTTATCPASKALAAVAEIVVAAKLV